MEILAHRGYWNEMIFPNSKQALHCALERGFGIESDVRDCYEQLVIAHNIANGLSFSLESIFVALAAYQNQYCFAINIKADGLADQLLHLIEKYRIDNYFTFDMSFPQMLEYREKGLRYFTRQSEYETYPLLYSGAAGVWIDGFQDMDWITEDLISRHQEQGKKVCLVSPELHHKEYCSFWSRLKQFQVDHSQVMLCTDHPEEAQEFFL